MANLPLPRGVRDLMPNEALFRNEMLKKIERVYQSFGFLTIDTPTFESLSVLKAKNAIGEENKLIYELKDEDLGLRYDHTVSLARYYSMHQELPLPFKRYYIGKNWRKEEPQKNRYREFIQADVDILGGRPIYTDAEAIAAAAKALEALGVDYEIKLNDRRFVDMILKGLGVKADHLKAVYRAVDKLDKLEVGEVAKMLLGIGLTKKQVDELVKIIRPEGEQRQEARVHKEVREGPGRDSGVRRAAQGAWDVWPEGQDNRRPVAGARDRLLHIDRLRVQEHEEGDEEIDRERRKVRQPHRALLREEGDGNRRVPRRGRHRK